MLKKGLMVTIYQDPYTQLKPEGTAILVRKTADWDEGYERWLVDFEGDGRYERTIKAEGKCTSIRMADTQGW